MNELIVYLSQLPLWQLVWLVLTFIIGISLSIRNYSVYFISKLSGKRFNQNLLGTVIDWLWLTSVIVLTVLSVGGK